MNTTTNYYQKEKYIKDIKDLYYKDVENYQKSMLSSSIYKNNSEYTNHQIRDPYNIDEIPEWYPEILKLYLTEVSCEMLKYTYPCKINLHNKNKSLNTIYNEAILNYYNDIGSTEDAKKEYFEYELDYKFGTLTELIEIGKKVAIIKSTLLTIGDGGCTLEHIYCPINDKVACVCYDRMTESGIINEYEYLTYNLKHGISLEDYIFDKKLF